MAKKLTITVDDEVYAGLHSVIGRRRISRFLNDLARPHVTRRDLAEGCAAMAADEAREREAAEWVETLTGDPVCITRRGKPVAQIVGLGRPRRRIDVQALRALTDAMPLQPETAGDFVRRMREGDRY